MYVASIFIATSNFTVLFFSPTEENTLRYASVTPSRCNIQGRRVVDMEFFLRQIKEIDDHVPFHCSFKDMEPVREVRRGLISGFAFKCNMCNIEKTLWTDDNQNKTSVMDVNSSAVSATVSTGGGHAQLEEIMSTMNIPCLSSNTFKKYHDVLTTEWEKAAQREMEEAVKLEIEEARKRGHIDIDGIPLLTVMADGSWGKRSYKNKYNSLVGVVSYFLDLSTFLFNITFSSLY